MKYRLWVVGKGGVPFDHEVHAVTALAAHRVASTQGLTVLNASPIGEARFRLRRSDFDLVLFTRSLLTLLQAGLALIEGLKALSNETGSEARGVGADLLESLGSGKSFADALEAHGRFPELYVALVRAAEHTSDLPAALERYLRYATQVNEVRQKLISAAIYPAVLIAAGLAAVAFLTLYVIPRFAGIYEGMRGDLPWAATAMMHWGLFVKKSGVEFGLTIAVLAIFVTAALAGAVRHGAFTRFVARLPRMGEQIRVFHLSRLYRTVGMLLEGGIPMVRALEMSIDLLPTTMRGDGGAATQAIREGQRPSSAFRQARLSTAISEQMLAVGERSGTLGSMMTRVAEYYETETTRRIERAMKVVEPLLMTAIGLGIGFIVVLMYLPIFELAGSIR